MNAPLYSTVTLIAELFVSSAIYYTFYSGYKKDKLPEKLAIGAIAYEILFNVSYMVYRVPTHHPDKPDSAGDIALAAFHGILSLIMFISLIVFFVVAIKKYRQGINYF